MQKTIVIRIVKIILWLIGLYVSAYYSFPTIYFAISGLYFMFTNLGKRKKGTLSAYSVFNDNFQRLQGTMDGLSLFKGGLEEEKQKFTLERSSPTEQENAGRQQYFKNQSKYSNKACFCGSSLKFKKCCLPAERKRLEEQRIKRIKGQ